MRRLLVLLVFTLSATAEFAQPEDQRSEVYAACFGQDFFGYDSVYRKQITTVMIAPITAPRAGGWFEADYLRDYLNGRLCYNRDYLEFVEPKGRDTLSWLSYPFKLAAAVRSSRETGRMLVALDSLMKCKQSVPLYFQKNSKYVKLNDAKQVTARGWRAFYRQFPKCYGLIQVSEIIFSDDGQRAVFYQEERRDGLYGEGGIVFMKKSASGWESDFYLLTWIS